MCSQVKSSHACVALLAPVLGFLVLLSHAARAEKRSPEAPSRIVIGGTLPLSGPEAKAGGFFKEGYDLALAEANAKGGLKLGAARVPVSLTILDDGSAAGPAVALARQLVEKDKVHALLGTFGSDLVEPQSTVAEENRVPYVSGSGAASAIFQRKYRYVFGLQSPIKLLASTEMDWIAEHQKAGDLPEPATIALVWEDTAHGRDYREGVLHYAQRKPGAFRIVVDEPFEMNRKDWKPLVAKLKAAKTDLFLADAHLPDFIAMHREYLAQGLCHKVVTYGARGSDKQAVTALGQTQVAYILSAVWWDQQLGTSGLNQAFVQAFRQRYQRSPEWYQALGYEAARVLMTGIERAGSVDREAVREALAHLKMETILPVRQLSFPADYGQQAHYPFVVLQNQPEGGATIVYPRYVASGIGVAPNPRCAL